MIFPKFYAQPFTFDGFSLKRYFFLVVSYQFCTLGFYVTFYIANLTSIWKTSNVAYDDFWKRGPTRSVSKLWTVYELDKVNYIIIKCYTSETELHLRRAKKHKFKPTQTRVCKLGFTNLDLRGWVLIDPWMRVNKSWTLTSQACFWNQPLERAPTREPAVKLKRTSNNSAYLPFENRMRSLIVSGGQAFASQNSTDGFDILLIMLPYFSGDTHVHTTFS